MNAAKIASEALAILRLVEDGAVRRVRVSHPDSEPVHENTEIACGEWLFRVFVDGCGINEWDYIAAVKPPGLDWIDLWATGPDGLAHFHDGAFEELANYRPCGPPWMF